MPSISFGGLHQSIARKIDKEFRFVHDGISLNSSANVCVCLLKEDHPLCALLLNELFIKAFAEAVV